MMKSRIILVLSTLVSLLMFTSQSQAFFAEPILGYKTGTVTQTGSLDSTLKGVYLGGRVGMGIPVIPFFWLALDGGITTGGKQTTGALEADADQTLLGLTAGVDIPVVPVIDRVWLGYNFIDNVKAGTTTTKGSSLKLGLGLKFIPFVSLNIEYIKETWTESETSGVTTALANDINSNSFLFSVSLPLP